MDLGTIIIAIVFISFVTVPFILTGHSYRRKKKYLFRRLTNMAEKEGCRISRHEFCGNLVIGIDETSNHLFFYKKVESLEFENSINLSDFKSCRVINLNRTVADKKEKLYVVDKLDLCFYPVSNEKPEYTIEIYNDEHDSLSLQGELQLAEKWEKLLNERFKTPLKSNADLQKQPVTTVTVPKKQRNRKPVAA